MRDIRTEQKRDAIDHAVRIWDRAFPRLQATREQFNLAVKTTQNAPRGENQNG